MAENTNPQPLSSRSKATAAFHRIIGTSRPSTSAGPISQLTLTSSNLSNYHGGTRTASYDLQVPMQALSAAPDQDLVVVAGREVLKVLKVTPYGEISEKLDLRAGNAANKTVDVKWGCNFSKDVIATANTNGNICVYDMNKGGKLDTVMHEHQRSVQKIAFNPGNGKIMISGSQDGTMKIWDLRQKKSTMTMHGKSDVVWDVQFNATNAVHFAAAFENGTIQKWEWRMVGASNNYLRKISAHNGPVFSIDWHPDGKYVASGGRDKTVKVWDFSDSDFAKRRPQHTINTMAAIGRATWRPCELRTREIATCAMSNDNRITVWDIKRPFVGKYVFDEHTIATSGLLWKDENTLWSCSKDQLFVQHDLLYASHPINSLNHSAVAWAPDMNFMAVLGQRPPPPSKKERIVRFEADEDANISGSRKKQERTSSAKLSRAGVQVSAMDSLGGKYVPQQNMFEVALPMFSPAPLIYMAQNWATSLKQNFTLSEACQQNSQVAWAIGQYRAAQTWKMLDLIHGWEMEARQQEEDRLNKEIADAAQAKLPPEAGIFAKRALAALGQDRRSSNGSAGATPLAKPVTDTPHSMLTPVPSTQILQPLNNIEDSLALPPQAFGTSVSSSTTSTDGGEGARVDAIKDSQISLSDVGKSVVEKMSYTETQDGSERDKVTPLRSDFVSISSEKINRGSSARDLKSDPPESTELPTPSSYDRAFGAPRARQFSIGLTSDQTSSSYDDSSDSFALSADKGTSHHVQAGYAGDDDDEDDSPHPKTEPNSKHLLAETIGKDIQEMVKDYGEIKLKGSGYGRMKNLPWNLQNFLTVLTNYYSDRGEVQMCATLALLFGNLVNFDERRMRDWIEGYIEQLYRFKLYVTSAEVTKATTMESIRTPAQTNTFVHLSCGHCNAPLSNQRDRMGSWYCESCNKIADGCVVCHGNTKRKWTMCEGCCHGGHDDCLRSWYLESKMRQCPSGCGHTCI